MGEKISKKLKIIIIGAAILLVVIIIAIIIVVVRGRNKHQNIASNETTDNETTSKEDVTTTEEESSGAEGDSNTSAGYEYTFTKTNSWTSGSNNCYQFDLSVKNTSESDIKSWVVTATVPAGTKISSSWNCECVISGTTLTVKPVDYNALITSGGSIKDIGIIMESASAMDTFTGNGSTTDFAAGSTSGGVEAQTSQSGGNTQTETTAGNITPYSPPSLESGTPLANHGKLTLNGTDIVDKNGNKYQLKGVSTHGIAWFPQYVNKDAFKSIRDWGGNVIRLAMYTAESGGYCNGGNQTELETTVDNGVKYATELGMYVIIDWHVLNDAGGNPNTYKSQAETFWRKMSAKYQNYDNVIYEICNEPNGGTSWNDVKTYADDIISIIRANDKDAIIIVGTPTWSQDVDQAAANPVSKPYNVMYALHFYAATHKDNIRNKLTAARNAGAPVFISEFSICDASGNGGIDYDSANTWKSLINQYNVSYCAWSLCNKAETAALIKSSCSLLSGWSTSDLSDTGVWLRSMIGGQ